MPSMKTKADDGNALVEFIAFALLVFAPMATFAAETANAWVAKQQAVSAATQLARAYANGPIQYESLSARFRAQYPSLRVESSLSPCCVQVTAMLGEAWATAKQIL